MLDVKLFCGHTTVQLVMNNVRTDLTAIIVHNERHVFTYGVMGIVRFVNL